MQWWTINMLLVVMTHGGGGVTKNGAGTEQFWTDDYKIFDQVYGKTSDKDIYGETLPSTITFNRHHDKKPEASQKKERLVINYNDPDSEQLDTYNFPNQYPDMTRTHSVRPPSKKPTKSTVNFVSYSNHKPISLESNPETYNYLKHLEEFNNEEKFHIPKTVGGFKPYLNYGVSELEEADTYKSIQDIIDSQEVIQDNSSQEDDNNMKYLSYPESYPDNKRKKPPRIYNESYKPRCFSNCKKRGVHYRLRRRPYRWIPSKTVVVL